MNKKTLCSIYRRGAYAAYSARLAKRRKKVRHDSSRKAAKPHREKLIINRVNDYCFKNLAKVLIELSLLLFKEANSVFLEVSVEITDLFFSISVSISLLSVSKSAFACVN